ncbi:hypothetical protein QJS10_CPA01g01222 [Acorus calamus]|uniref:Uncharacterized protein n=1 Tax=Acorus calamus TaxID=4465 RepID=A0AAV9FLS8_ACOCL|nr:hypothetical protein QJS10_CPA01g01222 [Acorus calamus]
MGFPNLFQLAENKEGTGNAVWCEEDGWCIELRRITSERLVEELSGLLAELHDKRPVPEEDDKLRWEGNTAQIFTRMKWAMDQVECVTSLEMMMVFNSRNLNVWNPHWSKCPMISINGSGGAIKKTVYTEGEIIRSGFMINSSLRRRTHLVQSFSVVFLYWFYVFS